MNGRDEQEKSRWEVGSYKKLDEIWEVSARWWERPHILIAGGVCGHREDLAVDPLASVGRLLPPCTTRVVNNETQPRERYDCTGKESNNLDPKQSSAEKGTLTRNTQKISRCCGGRTEKKSL